MTLFYATIDPHFDTPVVWEFTVKPRKNGSYKAEGMMSFMGYITIMQKHHVDDCGQTSEEAIEKLTKRKLRLIETLNNTRNQLVAEVNQINAAEPRLIKFPIQPKAKPSGREG